MIDPSLLDRLADVRTWDDFDEVGREVLDALKSAADAEIAVAVDASPSDGLLAGICDFCVVAGRSLSAYVDLALVADRYVAANAASSAAALAGDPELPYRSISSWPLVAAMDAPLADDELLELVRLVVERAPDLDDVAFALGEGPLSTIGGKDGGEAWLQERAAREPWLARLLAAHEAYYPGGS